MKISELIEKLEIAKQKHGDKEISICIGHDGGIPDEVEIDRAWDFDKDPLVILNFIERQRGE